MNTVRKGATKHCVFGECKSDSRYGVAVDFISFPKACLAVRRKLINPTKKHIQDCSLCQKCSRWMHMCKRNDGRFSNLYDVNKHTYICKNHFVSEVGPCEMYPDPLTNNEVLRIRESPRQKKLASCEIGTSTSSDTLMAFLNVNTKETSVYDTINIQTSSAPDYTNLESLIDGISNVNLQLMDKPALCTLLEMIKVQHTKEKYNLVDSATQTKLELVEAASIKTTSQHTLYRTTATQTTFIFKDLQIVKNENVQLRKDITKLRREITAIKNPNETDGKSKAVTLFVESLRENEKKCKFYTNLTFNQILALLGFLLPVDNLIYWGTSKPVAQLQKKRFSHLEELVITLVRLRTGLLVEDLSYRYEVSTGLITKIVTTWVQHAYTKFDCIRFDMFASREIIRENLPAVFKRLKNIRVIIDCAEFYCQQPSNFEQQGNLYSSYKAHTTFKVLLGCTPNGAVSFVSELFEGSISDKEIVAKSKLLELLEAGDLVLADRGFDIKRLTDSKNVLLNIPPFLKGRDTLTAEEEIETKNIAKERIYIEHVVGRLKQFRLLKKVLPLSMRGILSQIVFVCACLINFQEPILDKDENL